MAMTSFLGDNRAMQTIRARVAFHTRQHGFDRTAKQLVEGASSAATDRLVADLYAYWGDPLSQSDERFLRSALSEAQQADGAILQCGTSLGTLLLGAICDQDDNKTKQLWCLESDRHWSNLMRSWLTEYKICSAHIIHSRSRIFGDYVWYSLDPQRLAKKYALIICDGARATAQGVIGTLSRLDKRLNDRFVILARNVGTTTDLKVLAAWAKLRNASCVVVDKTEGFIKIASKEPDLPPLPESRTGPTALRNSRRS
jgi:hypothetical protein